MRLAVLADIHGNLPALDAVLDDLERRRVDGVVNLGDCASGPL
jgi:predicted phosphodiesterase